MGISGKGLDIALLVLGVCAFPVTRIGFYPPFSFSDAPFLPLLASRKKIASSFVVFRGSSGLASVMRLEGIIDKRRTVVLQVSSGWITLEIRV